MTTIKLKKPAGPASTPPARGARPPVRGINAGLRVRPTQAEAEAYRARRDETRRAEVNGPERKPVRPTVIVQDAPPRRHATSRGSPRAEARPAAAPAKRVASPPTRPARSDPFDKPRKPAHDAPRADPRPAIDTAHADGSLRLSKRMSQLGIASRREADEWIARGWVRVDGRVIGELGARVLPSQHVTVDAHARNQQADRVTVLLNKPIGYVSGQAENGHEPAFVLVQPETQWRDDHSGRCFLRTHLRSLVPAGRLDIDSTGLLVLTQDGRVAKQLVGAGGEIEKEYLVRVTPIEGGGWQASKLALLQHGLELDGEALRPARVEWLNDDQLRVVLQQGKKRQIRRMCEAVGLHVTGLKRVRIGGVMLGDLPVGQWRYLRHGESFGEIDAARPQATAPATAATDRSMQVEVAAEEADQPDHDQIDRDDEIEQARHGQDEDAGDQ